MLFSCRRYKRVASNPPEEVISLKLKPRWRWHGLLSKNANARLPHERVVFARQNQYSRFDEGQVLQVLDASPERVTPSCPHFMQCGGCLLQHMSPMMQLQTKLEAVQEHLQHFGGIVMPHFEPAIVSSSTYGYRMQARLGVRYVAKKGRILVGFRERNGRYLTDMTTCKVLHPEIGEHLEDLSDLISHMQGYQSVPKIDVAMGDEGPAFVFRHLLDLSQVDLDLLKAFGRDENVHIYLQPVNENTIRQIWPESSDDLLHYTHPDHGVTLAFHPSNFIQVNLTVNQRMVSQAIRWLDLQGTETVLDLFCGIGNFSVPLAKYAGKVVAIEGCEDMTQRVMANAKANQLGNIEAFQHNLMEPIDGTMWAKQAFDAVLLDPPKEGVEECIPWLLAMKPARILYVSSQSATFARDAAMLVQGGYLLTKMGLMDMFPHTSHIETMALFQC